MAKKLTLDKFIKILTDIRDKHNAGDYSVLNSKFTEYSEHWVCDLINMDRKDIIINNDEKFVGVDAHILFKNN